MTKDYGRTFGQDFPHHEYKKESSNIRKRRAGNDGQSEEGMEREKERERGGG